MKGRKQLQFSICRSLEHEGFAPHHFAFSFVCVFFPVNRDLIFFKNQMLEHDLFSNAKHSKLRINSMRHRSSMQHVDKEMTNQRIFWSVAIGGDKDFLRCWCGCCCCCSRSSDGYIWGIGIVRRLSRKHLHCKQNHWSGIKAIYIEKQKAKLIFCFDKK